MAQLIKLQDYISRYQVDLTRYPTQFVRLKKVQWDRVKMQWEKGEEIPEWEHIEEVQEQKKRSLFKKIFSPRTKIEEVPEDIERLDTSNEFSESIYHTEDVQSEGENNSGFTFEANFLYRPQSLHDLKRMYLNQFYQFQIQWASSTLREKSYVDPRFLRDPLLRTILLNLPDNYLVFYYPIIKLKKAPVEIDIVILMPTECLCITVIEEEDQAVYVGSNDRFWTKKVGKIDKKVLNPMIQSSRMETILKQIFATESIDIPITKVLLSRNGYIDYPGSAYNVEFIDKRRFPDWFEGIRKSQSPMKHMQIRAAQSILNYVQTTSFNRDIWQSNIEVEDQE